ncbi:hypothetical protein GJ744_000970 [Endocarpon pusillum]|uniref:Uncharacterized protein n=1 Tax=Endocarpon pusillum TaxID=364733 RepID=A0A8H7ACC0_9EURO|nr:hypothetical protein GJ744_000970 [Endocarpon pusillum]
MLCENPLGDFPDLQDANGKLGDFLKSVGDFLVLRSPFHSVFTQIVPDTYSAIVFASQQYRKAYADHMENVVISEHKSPVEFRANAGANIRSRYNSIHFQNSIIESAAKKADGTIEMTDPHQNKYHCTMARSSSSPRVSQIFEERGAVSTGVLALGFIKSSLTILHIVQEEFQGKPLVIEPKNIAAVKRKGKNVMVQFKDGDCREEAFLVPSS